MLTNEKTQNYHTHLDSLSLKFKSIDNDFFNRFKSNNFYLKDVKDLHFHYSYEVYYIPLGSLIVDKFATIKVGRLFNTKNSIILLENKSLYIQGWNNVLTQLLFELNLPKLFIDKIEIAKDTNEELTSIYAKKYIKNKLTYSDKYNKLTFSGGMHLLKPKNDLKLGLTYYIKKEKNSNFDRIENKTNEINESSHKQYIISYLTRYIDISKPIFRLEKTLNFEDLSYTNIVYLSKDGEIITKYFFDKLTELDKSNYKPNKETSYLNIDLTRLDSSTYLDSIFDSFKVFDYEKILKPFKFKKFEKSFIKSYSEKPTKPTKPTVNVNEKEVAEIEKHIFLLETQITEKSPDSIRALGIKYKRIFE